MGGGSHMICHSIHLNQPCNYFIIYNKFMMGKLISFTEHMIDNYSSVTNDIAKITIYMFTLIGMHDQLSMNMI